MTSSKLEQSNVAEVKFKTAEASQVKTLVLQSLGSYRALEHHKMEQIHQLFSVSSKSLRLVVVEGAKFYIVVSACYINSKSALTLQFQFFINQKGFFLFASEDFEDSRKSTIQACLRIPKQHSALQQSIFSLNSAIDIRSF